MQHPLERIQDSTAVEFEEGTLKITGSAAYPITRFDNLPFGIRASGGNMELLFGYSDKNLTDNPVWVGLGSSTMAGHGLPSGEGYGDRIDTRQGNVAVGARQWVNLGLDGQNSAALLPTAQGGDPSRNIDAAMSYNPSFVIVDEPTNWALSWDAAQQRLNYLSIFNYAWQHGVITLFNSSRPRTQFNTAQQQRLADFAALCLADPLLRYIVCPTFTPFLKAGTIGEIKNEYDQGDGIHLNAAGTQLLEQLSWAFWGKLLRPRTAYLRVEIHRSTDDSTYTLFDTITDQAIIRKTYPLQEGYYKARAALQDGSFTAYSNTIQLTGGTPAPAGRLLIDLGGDGVTTLDSGGNPKGSITPSPDENGNHWNNFVPTHPDGFSDGAAISDLVDTAGNTTGISVAVVRDLFGTFFDAVGTKGINYQGMTLAVGEYPATACEDSMFANNSVNDGQLSISGLNPLNTYTVKFWGTRDTGGVVDNRFIEIKKAQDNWPGQNYNGAMNTDPGQAAVFTGITDVNEQAFDARVLAGSTFGYIGIIEISWT